MMPTVIPEWTLSGVLPPISPASPTSIARSPYRVRLSDGVMRFSSSPKRQLILSGYLEHRKALHGVGLTSSFRGMTGITEAGLKPAEEDEARGCFGLIQSQRGAP